MTLIDEETLDALERRAAESGRLRASQDLRMSPDDNSQRMLNALLPGTVVPVHRHQKTVETVIALRGAVTEIFYDDSGKETSRHRLDPKGGLYGIQIPAGQWHNVEVCEPCVIIEVKDGKYAPSAPEDLMTI